MLISARRKHDPDYTKSLEDQVSSEAMDKKPWNIYSAMAVISNSYLEHEVMEQTLYESNGTRQDIETAPLLPPLNRTSQPLSYFAFVHLGQRTE